MKTEIITRDYRVANRGAEPAGDGEWSFDLFAINGNGKRVSMGEFCQAGDYTVAVNNAVAMALRTYREYEDPRNLCAFERGSDNRVYKIEIEVTVWKGGAK